MIPSRFIRVESFSVTANGKLDLSALPQAMGGKEEPGSGPQTDTELQLRGLWATVLDLEEQELPVNASFFEMGGHSLRALRLLNSILKELNVQITLAEVFRFPTIRQMAEVISQKRPSISLPVLPAEIKDHYPLSHAQKRLFTLYRMNKEQLGYNIPMVLSVKGSLDEKRLEGSIRTIIQRHEILRTGFLTDHDEPVQVVHKDVPFGLLTFEYQDSLKDILRQFLAPFDLSRPPLLRVGLIKKQDEHILLVDMHHIVTDGVSLQIMVEELVSLYNGEAPPPLRIQYKDYVGWLNSGEVIAGLERQEQFWLNEFSGEVPVCDLLHDHDRSPIKSYKGANAFFYLSKEEKDGLNQLALEENATLYMVLLSVYLVLISRLSDQRDIVIGSPVSGRSRAELEPLIGMFVNMLAIRNEVPGEVTFSELLQQVRDKCIRVFDNQDFPFGRLVERLKIRPVANRHPLFDITFSFQNIPNTDYSIPDLAVNMLDIPQATSKFDLSLHGFESGEGLRFVFEYDTDLFTNETIQRFITYFRRLVQEVLRQPGRKVREIEMLSEEEKKEQLQGMQELPVTYPDLSIGQKFAKAAATFPDHIAIVQNDNQLTYSELDRQAGLLAQHLKEQGVVRGNIVGIMAERSMDSVIGILAILKAGAAYLPIDPGYPKERVDFMLRDSNVQFVLKARGTVVGSTGILLIDIDRERSSGEWSPDTETSQPADDCAYVIYTSGTTGRPKGVLVTHRNVVRLLFNSCLPFSFSEKDTWTLFHSLSFDFSVWEMFGALLYGGKLVIIPRTTAQQASVFIKLLRRHQVTVVNQTPSAFYNLLEEERNSVHAETRLRYIIFGGEALKLSRLLPWKEKYPDTRLINMFGITETTVHTTIKEIAPEDIRQNRPNIGKPLPTTSVFIFGADKELLPAGVTGELYVGGEGVARGYLNRPELTHERFVRHAYDTEKRLYRSGDRARIRGGELEYDGRTDSQVKLRGFRIETSEIESRLLQYPQVKKAVVILSEINNGKMLCAYYTGSDELAEMELREYLGQYLPDYMVPAHFIRVSEMPLTIHGKIDIRALPEPALNIYSDYVAPATSLERELAEIVARRLGMDSSMIGVETNFIQLGLNSLSLTSLLVDIYNTYNVEISLMDIFQKPDVSQLSKLIEMARSFSGTGMDDLNEQEIIL
jgi:amino acid adenylation domain-containing protein